ncbi:LLM class F420-dependent oxidoreductase [Gryllotalpicola sp.]|uniref:LLM class F420-dependent oxidoreductase n=1 Tax=Gryllotalpicola sp. TaxID=1932787 RepID=UPI00261377AF|nr:LLM class F420-dependent oxidoreductase [Gryllotalpicola sp.]
MEFALFVEPQQGGTYADQLDLARQAEDLGFDAFFRSDHFHVMGRALDGLPGPTDSWITLAGLARETEHIRLGTLVTSMTFRLPGVLAIQVAQVDDMSGGRVELGLGAGWFEREHEAYGIPFPATRFPRLEEQLAIVTGLWSTPVGARYSFAGEYYVLTDSPALPKPVQSPPPVIVGGTGPSRTPALAAKYANEYNAGFGAPDELSAAIDRSRRACEAIGRDPKTLKTSAVRALHPGDAPDAVARDIAAREALGVGRVYLQLPDLGAESRALLPIAGRAIAVA